MRDKNRISKILNELDRIWKANPDFRLGQLIVDATKPKDSCPEVFYIEDEKLLEGLLNFENKSDLETHEQNTLPDWKKYSNVSRINLDELTMDLLVKLISEIKETNRKMVITPISLMKLNGAPVADQTWLQTQKIRIERLAKLLSELKGNGVLHERKSTQIEYEIVE